MKQQRKKIGKWDVIVWYDKYNQCVTITSVGQGGAIVSGGAFEEIEKKWLVDQNIAEASGELIKKSKLKPLK